MATAIEKVVSLSESIREALKEREIIAYVEVLDGIKEVRIEVENYNIDEEEFLKKLVEKLKEEGYNVDAVERCYWDAVTEYDLLTGEVINEEDVGWTNHWMICITIWSNDKEIEEVVEDVVKAIKSI